MQPAAAVVEVRAAERGEGAALTINGSEVCFLKATAADVFRIDLSCCRSEIVALTHPELARALLALDAIFSGCSNELPLTRRAAVETPTLRLVFFESAETNPQLRHDLMPAFDGLLALASADLSFSSVGTEGLVKLLPCCPLLQHLRIEGNTVSDDGLLALASHMQKHQQLRTLSLSNCEGFTDEGVSALMRHGGSSLRMLQLANCGASIDAVANGVVTSMEDRSLAVSNCTMQVLDLTGSCTRARPHQAASPHPLTTVCMACPDLKELTMRSSSVSDEMLVDLTVPRRCTILGQLTSLDLVSGSSSWDSSPPWIWREDAPSVYTSQQTWSTSIHQHMLIHRPYTHTCSRPYTHTCSRPYTHTCTRPYTHTCSRPYTHTCSRPYTHTCSRPCTHTCSRPYTVHTPSVHLPYTVRTPTLACASRCVHSRICPERLQPADRRGSSNYGREAENAVGTDRPLQQRRCGREDCYSSR
jgi:hypothetical protein